MGHTHGRLADFTPILTPSYRNIAVKVIPGQTFTRFTTGDLACCVYAVPGTKKVWTNE